MPDYKSSIKCRYCEHYDPDGSLCYRYSQYDSVREVSPNSRCKYFQLNDLDMMANAVASEQGGTLPRRKDGSFVASLEDVPELVERYRAQEVEAEEKRKRNMILLIGGLAIFWLLIFWPFLEMFFDILNFLF